MLSSVCEITSWLDCWLSTCGGFREHIPDEVCGNFEWLILSGSRALEFLDNQGVTALGNLVLSHRDFLLLNALSTVPAEEVALLRYADLPSSPGIFPSSLLDSALTKICTASNNALVQRTLHPPEIPRKSSSGPSKAGSSSASFADRGGVSHVVPRSQHQASMAPSSSSSQQGGKKRGRKGKALLSAAPAASVANEKGPGRSPPDGVSPLLLVGGCLSAHWRYWQTIGAGSWVVSVLRYGYHIPFLDSPPPLSCTPISFATYRVGFPRSLALRQEIEKMSKDALEIVLDLGRGFYSHLFLVEKVTGGWRPVIDLSHLNEFVLQTPFQLETVASVLLSIREGDFLASIDLKDAYFQIPVHQSSRKLLRFLPEGAVYQFKALCFELLTAPQVFTKVFAAVSAWAHSHRIRLLWYLDDWLVLASSEAEAKKNVQDLLSVCHPLGIVINEEKSDLVPSETANYLSMTIDTGTARIFPSNARVEKFLSVAETFCTMSAPPLSFGRWFWVTWLCWRGWVLTVDFECALCSGI